MPAAQVTPYDSGSAVQRLSSETGTSSSTAVNSYGLPDLSEFSSSAENNASTPGLSSLPRDRLDSAPELKYIRNALIGEGLKLPGPFGPRRLTYCDYVASGRALTFVEDYIRHEVLPLYGNTHSESSATGRRMTALREEARSIIAESVNASRDDAVIFAGSGSTGAIHLFVEALKKRPDFARPLVLLGPYEHNSNRLIWRELADVVCINEAAAGGPDLRHLEAVLKSSQHKLKIGSFSAASNVTGALTDTVRVTKLLRRYGALACFDYAAAAPYMPIDMNPHGAPKDAIFVSTHKFVGGVGAPGLLIVKKKLMRNSVPVVPGGGTVLFVDEHGHEYLEDIEVREEGGTPDILGSIRTGLAFQIKNIVGTDLIAKREHQISKRVMAKLTSHHNVLLLGSPENDRLPTFSFLLRHSNTFLHDQFVVTLLSDLFGIQARGGCACAGPYSIRLLGVSEEDIPKFVRCLHSNSKSSEIVKPGFVRFNVPYFFTDDQVDFVTNALLYLADYGWMFLPHYVYDPKRHAWITRAAASRGALAGESGSSIRKFTIPNFTKPSEPGPPTTIAEAHSILQRLLPTYPESLSPELDSTQTEIQWFLTPHEALREIANSANTPIREREVLRPVDNGQERNVPVPDHSPRKATLRALARAIQDRGRFHFRV